MNRQQIHLEPISRIEGTMRVSIQLDERGNVETAHASAMEFRAFEAFLRGRHLHRVPGITPRICGVCPAPHHLASAKAIEAGLEVRPSERTRLLRELMLVVDHAGDHLLHMFLLAGPDVLLADQDPEQRGFPALYARHPEVVRDVLSIRKIVQTILSALGVTPVHPATWIPGGITSALEEPERVRFLQDVRQAKDKILSFQDRVLPAFRQAQQAYEGLGSLKTHFIGLFNGGNLELYEGKIRIVDGQGAVRAEFEPADYARYLAERTVDHSYAKEACYVSQPSGEMLRTGPISRLNLAESASTNHAARMLREFKSLYGKIAQDTLALNVARYVATVYAIERAEQILEDPAITGRETPPAVTVRAGEGVGIIEAPRGLLVHHFQWDNDGYITKANIITPTGVNAHAIDSCLKEVAERSINSGKVEEKQLDHEIGMTIRAYDPCLSCATHALSPGGNPWSIEILDAAGRRIL